MEEEVPPWVEEWVEELFTGVTLSSSFSNVIFYRVLESDTDSAAVKEQDDDDEEGIAGKEGIPSITS